MFCPFCGAQDTKVIVSRLAAEGHQVRRRRECPSCTARFTTFENAELSLPRVIKGDGSRQPFDGSKLRSGMMRAMEKRPVSIDKIDIALDHILRKARALGDREVEARQVGDWVMEELRQLDEVAYVRFASVYRSFQDVDEFREEIERMQKRPGGKQQIPLLDSDEPVGEVPGRRRVKK